jgi:hypothetical protein
MEVINVSLSIETIVVARQAIREVLLSTKREIERYESPDYPNDCTELLIALKHELVINQKAYEELYKCY